MPTNQPSIALVSCDIDGTVLGEPRTESSDADTRELARAWQSQPPERPLLIYNTGRVLHDALATIAETPLLQPDFLIAGVGSAIHDFGQDLELVEFQNELKLGWDRDRVMAVVESPSSGRQNLERQPEAAQTAFKASWYWHKASPGSVELLEDELRASGLDVQLVYSSQRDLDILPASGNKGGALSWLIRRLGIVPEAVVVAGDTGNDLRQFQVPGVRGILPGNARPELRRAIDSQHCYLADGHAAAGVLEGLRFWGLNL